MAVSAIQENNNNKSRKMGTIASVVVGGFAGGYSKYLLPLNPPEKNDPRYTDKIKEIKTRAKQAKIAEIESIKNSNAAGADVFTKIINSGNINIAEIKKLDENVARQVIKLITQINNEAREVFQQGKSELIATTKAIRPARAFIAIGAGAGLLIATVNNIFIRNDNNCNQCKQDKED